MMSREREEIRRRNSQRGDIEREKQENTTDKGQRNHKEERQGEREVKQKSKIKK